MASYLRMKLLLTRPFLNQASTLILKRRLQQTELSPIRLYLQQLYNVLENSNASIPLPAPQTSSEPKAVIDYLHKLFIIFKKSAYVDGVSPDLTLETWRSFFSTTHRNDIALVLEAINKHEKYKQMHRYLEDNEHRLGELYTSKQLIYLFHMLSHLDNLNFSKTTLKLSNEFLEGNLDERYDLLDLFFLQSTYHSAGQPIEFKRRTANAARYKIFNHVNPSLNGEPYIGVYINKNDVDYKMESQDLSSNFAWLKTKLIYKYMRFFTSHVNSDMKNFTVDTLNTIDVSKNGNNFYGMNIISNIYGINRNMRKRMDYDSLLITEYLIRNKQFLFDNFHLMINKYNLLHMLTDLHKQRHLSLSDIEMMEEKLSQFLLKNDAKSLRVQNFLSIASVYDYLLYAKSFLLSKEYLQVPLGLNNDANMYSSSLFMGEIASYNHSTHESNTNMTANKSYFTYINLIRTMKETKPDVCHAITSCYNFLINSTQMYSLYSLSKSIIFILNVHTRQDFGLRLLYNVLAQSSDQLTLNQRLSSLLLSSIVLCNNYRPHVNKWPLILHLKNHLVKLSFRLDVQTKVSILNYILNSPATLIEVFHDISPILTEMVQNERLENCFVILRGINSNATALIENHPGLINRLANTIFQRICMQLQLPLVDIYEFQSAEIRHDLTKEPNYAKNTDLRLMVRSELFTERVSYYRIHRTYIYLMFMFKKLQKYPSFLDLNYIFKYVEHIDYSHLIRFFQDYAQKLEEKEKEGNDMPRSSKYLNESLLRYNIDKVLQKLIWLVKLQCEQSFYDAHQLDLLWSFLLFYTDFSLKNESSSKSGLSMRNHVVTSLTKVFTHFNYSQSNTYKMQSNLMAKLLDDYFHKHKNSFMFNELVSFANSLVSLGFHNQGVFTHLYSHMAIVDNTLNENEHEISVNGDELYRKFTRHHCDELVTLSQHLSIRYKDSGYKFIKLANYNFKHDFKYDRMKLDNLKSILIQVLGVSSVNFNPKYPYKLFANCELALNETLQFVDPRSSNVAKRIPVLFIDEAMCYLNSLKPNRSVEMLIENFGLLNYPILTIDLKEFESTRESKYEFVNNKLLKILSKIKK